MINLKKTTILGIIASFALVLSACSLYNKTPSQDQTTEQAQSKTQGQTQQSQDESAATITFAGGSVSPATVTIKSGESITWENKGTSAVQVASNPHPTHTDNRELTSGQSTLSLEAGALETVSLTKKGTWGFHDHLNPSVKGTVVVQ